MLPPTPSKHRPTSDPGTIVPVSDDEGSTDMTRPTGTTGTTGTTRLFPIIGDPITYVESPTRLTATLRERDHDGICIPRQVSAEDLGTVMAGLTATENVKRMASHPPIASSRRLGRQRHLCGAAPTRR